MPIHLIASHRPTSTAPRSPLPAPPPPRGGGAGRGRRGTKPPGRATGHRRRPPPCPREYLPINKSSAEENLRQSHVMRGRPDVPPHSRGGRQRPSSTRRYSFQPSSLATATPAAVRLVLFSACTQPFGVICSVFSRSSVW